MSVALVALVDQFLAIYKRHTDVLQYCMLSTCTCISFVAKLYGVSFSVIHLE